MAEVHTAREEALAQMGMEKCTVIPSAFTASLVPTDLSLDLGETVSTSFYICVIKAKVLAQSESC